MVSEQQLKETRTRINQVNRSRSKAHERRVASLLRGQRVLMSGAMKGYKGDVKVPLISVPYATYIVEAKLSAQIHGSTPELAFKMEWLEKLVYDAEASNALFGVFALHYHNKNILDDYVLIRHDDFVHIIERYPAPTTEVVKQLYIDSTILDIRYSSKNGRERRIYKFNKNVIEGMFTTHLGISGLKIMTRAGMYFLIRLRDFRDLMMNA